MAARLAVTYHTSPYEMTEVMAVAERDSILADMRRADNEAKQQARQNRRGVRR